MNHGGQAYCAFAFDLVDHALGGNHLQQTELAKKPYFSHIWSTDQIPDQLTDKRETGCDSLKVGETKEREREREREKKEREGT